VDYSDWKPPKPETTEEELARVNKRIRIVKGLLICASGYLGGILGGGLGGLLGSGIGGGAALLE